MRVGIDASYLLEPNKSGVETYTLNLVRALLALPDRPELFLYAAGRDVEAADAGPLLASADRARVSSITRLWLRLRLPLLMRGDRVDLAHFPGGILPRLLPCPAVVTFYDLAAARYPELYDPADLKLYDNVLPSAAHRAAGILTISESTKRDIVSVFGVDPGRIFVTPLGVHAAFRPVPDAGTVVRERFALARPYLLGCVGSGHPRKNLTAVVTAFDQLREPDLRLAIVGRADRDPQALAAVSASPHRDRIALLGHVPESDLPAIYSAATVFCFPSLYEGFGLPVLEAMACGTAVVCSDTSSLPEVVGDAALTVTPGDPGALAAAVASLLHDDARRQALCAAGRARAAQFTWEETARLTVAAYRAILDARIPPVPG